MFSPNAIFKSHNRVWQIQLNTSNHKKNKNAKKRIRQSTSDSEDEDDGAEAEEEMHWSALASEKATECFREITLSG